MSELQSPLIVGILHPSEFDVARFRQLTAASGRGVEVRLVGYTDSSELRQGKASGLPEEELRKLEKPLCASLRAALAECEAILALDVPFDLLQLAPKLRWTQAYGAGVGQLIRVLKGGEVRLTSASGVAAPTIAEFVMARLLEVWKHLPAINHQQQERLWKRSFGKRVAGLTLGIVGLGAIGTELARRASAFDMKVVGIRRQPERGRPSFVEAVYPPERLHELLAASDAVVVAAPETSETERLMGAAEFAAMRSGALFCNVARGSLVDEDALIEALQAGHLGAAILDVTREEPLPAGSPLWTAPGVLLSPHSSTSMEGLSERVMDLFAENLRRYAAGAEMRNVVDFSRGY